MKTFLLRVLLATGLALALGGCASVDASIDSGRTLKKVDRFFVVSNLNDNHAIDQQVAAAIRAHDRTAEVGPLTMMPDNTQAVVAFQDHWAWDFGEHLVYLRITVRDPLKQQTYAAVNFSATVPLHEPPATTVKRLVDALLEK